MEMDEKQKRTGLLALGLLGFLLIAVLVVLTVFDGDGEPEQSGSGDPRPAASGSTGSTSGGSGSTDGGASNGDPGAQPKPTPIVSLAEVGRAHQVMAQYMAGINTYDHTSTPARWTPPLLQLTTGDGRMKRDTSLPTGKAWDTCLDTKCSSTAKAVAERDAMVSDDLNKGSGQMLSTVVRVDIKREADGQTETESNAWLVTARYRYGEWRVTGFDLYGLGNVGSSDESGE
ncbi:hypothetical protein [Streptomyces sclerotialus]|uniref:hypothetical protein n=1 Tax=Streptomyces sclerotialus TaxID=1957 RepID=UPI0004CAAE9F